MHFKITATQHQDRFLRPAKPDYMRAIATIVMIFTCFVPSTCTNTSVSSINSSVEVVRLSMKFYGNHNPSIDNLIMTARPEYLVTNTSHGLYGEIYGYDSDWLCQNISGYQDIGIKIIGYISGGYEGGSGEDAYAPYWYSLDLNKKIIRNMAEVDGVDGVFIDECSSYPGTASKAYLTELSDLANNYGLIVWGNTGVSQFDEWYFIEGGFDLIQSTENWQGQSLSQVQQDWGHRIGVTGFESSYTAQSAHELTIDAWKMGIAFCYISETEYTTIAPWFNEYVELLRSNSLTGPADDDDNTPICMD